MFSSLRASMNSLVGEILTIFLVPRRPRTLFRRGMHFFLAFCGAAGIAGGATGITGRIGSTGFTSSSSFGWILTNWLRTTILVSGGILSLVMVGGRLGIFEVDLAVCHTCRSPRS